MSSEPRTHDYASRSLGHDYVYLPSRDETSDQMMGWGPLGGPKIQVGDFLILANDGDTTRYRVTEVIYSCDPEDMWCATVEFAPRSDQEKMEETPDHLEPVTFDWTPGGFKARVAARLFGEIFDDK